jgi:hypothetical protein
LNQLLLIINIITIIFLFSITVAQSNIGLLQNSIYGSAFPVACTLISIAFILFIKNRRRSDIINWQGRNILSAKKHIPSARRESHFRVKQTYFTLDLIIIRGRSRSDISEKCNIVSLGI